jgi:hypothetical protein
MVRAWRFTVLGGALLIGGVLLFAALGVVDLNPALLLQILMTTGAGVLLLLGGVGRELGPIKWYQLVGTGDVLLGLGLCVEFFWMIVVPGPLTGEGLLIGVAAVGGLSLAYIGIDWIRGGRHFDPSQFDSSLS